MPGGTILLDMFRIRRCAVRDVGRINTPLQMLQCYWYRYCRSAPLEVENFCTLGSRIVRDCVVFPLRGVFGVAGLRCVLKKIYMKKKVKKSEVGKRCGDVSLLMKSLLEGLEPLFPLACPYRCSVR